MKQLLSLILILAGAAATRADNVNVVNPPNKPVPVTTVSSIGGAPLTTTTTFSTRVTTNTTVTVVATTAYVNSAVVSVSAAGSNWVIRIQSKEATPKILYQATAVVGTVQPVNVVVPIGLNTGIEIVTTGTTAGTADIWVTYAK